MLPALHLSDSKKYLGTNSDIIPQNIFWIWNFVNITTTIKLAIIMIEKKNNKIERVKRVKKFLVQNIRINTDSGRRNPQRRDSFEFFMRVRHVILTRVPLAIPMSFFRLAMLCFHCLRLSPVRTSNDLLSNIISSFLSPFSKTITVSEPRLRLTTTSPKRVTLSIWGAIPCPGRY